jgi:hypothetical protein
VLQRILIVLESYRASLLDLHKDRPIEPKNIETPRKESNILLPHPKLGKP